MIPALVGFLSHKVLLDFLYHSVVEHSTVTGESWLEDFKSKFGQYDEAKPTIDEVEAALKLYKDTIGASKLKIDIEKARDARREHGSVLEYGLEWHLSRFVDDVGVYELSLF